MAAYLFNSPLHRGLFSKRYVLSLKTITIVRYLAEDRAYPAARLPRAPFIVVGAPNVILDTIKRSDDEQHTSSPAQPSAVILRLYEAFGGHAKAQLKIGGHLRVIKATVTNLLEDELESLDVTEFEDSSSIPIPFRGFQVITVKLKLAPSGHSAEVRSKGE